MQILRIIPLIFPALLEFISRIPWLARLAVLIHASRPMNESEALEALNRAQKWTRKLKQGYNDSTHVIKVSDAIECVGAQVNSAPQAFRVLKEALKAILGTPGNSLSQLGDDVVDCLRAKSLGQDSERVWSVKHRYHRPSRGHGRGRF